MRRQMSEFCIYTIVHGKELNKRTRTKKFTFHENKRWVTGHALWREANKAHATMPVLFGDAVNVERLLYWGVLTDIRVDGNTTSFTVDRLHRIQDRTRQGLILRSTRKPIARAFIRPYAICRTPAWLREAA